MSPGSFLLLAITVSVAAFIQGTVGMGFALILVPICGLVAPQLLPVALLGLMLPLNVFVAWRERSHLELNAAGWVILGRTIGALLGLWILTAITRGHLRLLIGWTTVVAALASLLAPSFQPERSLFMTAGVVAGVTETATGIGGPALALVFQHRQAPILRSTLAFCFAVGESISLALFLVLGLVPFRRVAPALGLLPFLAVGAYLSQHAHRHCQDGLLRRLVIGFAVVSGTLIILNNR